MSIISRLLNFLPGYFNLDPLPIPAFSLVYDDSMAVMRYTIADGVISAKTLNSFSNDFEIELEGKTVQDIVNEINLINEYQAVILSDSGKVNALRLIDIDEGDSPNISYFTNPIWALFKAVSLELKETKVAGDEILRALSIPSATSFLSDYWGTFFNRTRFSGEADDIYNQRIINSIAQPKCNNIAIEIILEDYYGYQIQCFDMDFASGTMMLMNNISTPVHNKSYPLVSGNTIGKEDCVFGLMFPESTISQWDQTQFDILKDIIYPIREGGCKAKLFWTDAPVFSSGDIYFEHTGNFYLKYL